jgi:hypothetical protein
MGTAGCALDDRELWWQANSGMWYRRVTERAMVGQRRKLPPLEFAREFLSWWDEPGAADAFGAGNWEACAGDPPSAELPIGGLAVAVSYDLTRATIGGGAIDDRDVGFVAPLQHGPGTGWVVQAAKRLQDRYGVDVVIDTGGPAADLITPLETAGVRLRKLETRDVLDSCAGIWKRVQERRLRHVEAHQELEAAAAAAVRRTVSDRWAWGRKQSDADISALEAATLALWLAEQPAPESWAFYE